MEKLQRFSIRKLSIGAVSCLIGTVSFLSYSHKVQAAETPQTVETAKAENEIQPDNAQESKLSKEVKDDVQNVVVDKDVVGSQNTGIVTTVNQASPKENVSAANEAAKTNEAAVISKAETNKLNGEGNETGSVDTTVLKTNTTSKEAKQNIADLAISTKMKLQAIRLAKPVQTVSPEQSADSAPITSVTNKASHESNSQAQPSSSIDNTQIKLVRRPVMRLAAATATNSDELIVGKDVTISDFSVTAAKGKNEFENSHANIKFTMHADDPSTLVGKRLTIQLDNKVWNGIDYSETKKANPTTISYQGQVIGTLDYGYSSYIARITFNNHVKDYTKISVQPDLLVSGNSQDNLPYKDYLYTPTQAKDGQTYYLTNDVTIGQQKYSSNLPSVIHYHKLGSESVSSVTNLTTTSYAQNNRELYAGTFYKTPDGIYYSQSAYYSSSNLYDEESGQPGELVGLILNVGTDVIADNTQSYTATFDIDHTKLSPYSNVKLEPIKSYRLIKDYFDDQNLLPNTSDVYVDYSWANSYTTTADAKVTENSVIFNQLNGQSLATQYVHIKDSLSEKTANYIRINDNLDLRPALFKQLQAVAESNQNLTEAIKTVTTTGRDAKIKLVNPIDTGVKATIKTSDGKTKEVPLLIDTIEYGIRTASTAPKGSILVSAQGKTAKVYHHGDQNIPSVVDQSQLTKTITRTINVHEPGKSVTTTKQTVTLTQSVSVVDGKDVTYNGDWKVQGDSQWASYDVPSVPGYTASQSHVAQQEVTDATKDQTVNITYTANDGTQTIVYQDEDGSEVGKQVISGKTDEKVKVTSDVPDGYVLKGEVPSEVTIKPTDNPITVTVEHGKSHVTPDKQVNKGDLIPGTKDKHYPEGLTHDDLNKTVTREITITDPTGKKTTTTQTVTFTRGATVDEVTNKVTYDAWSENGKHTFDKVDVPNVPGYTASGEVSSIVVTPETQSSKVDITYTANAQHMMITYVDDTTGKKLHTDKLNGVSDQDAKYATGDIIKQYEDQHYKLVSDSTNGKDLIFDHDDNADQTYEVHFIHGTHTINQTTSSKQTIHYVYADDLARHGNAADDNVQQLSFKRNGYNDEVTGTDHWNAWTPANSQYKAVDSPVIQGYTPDKAVIEKSTVNPTDKDTEITVVYNADRQTARIIYVDKTTNDVLTSDDLSGKSDKDSGYNTKDTIEKYQSQHYVLTGDETNGNNVIFDHDDQQDQTYYVYFVHGTKNVSRDHSASFTVHYIYKGGKQAKSDHKQTLSFTEDGIQDLVTQKITWTPADSQKFDDAIIPVITGYTPDQDKVIGQTANFETGDREVTVTYLPNVQIGHINYIDDNTGKTLTRDDFSGRTNEHKDYTSIDRIQEFENKGYVFVSSDYPDGGFTFDDNDQQDQVFNVHLKHGIVTVTSKNPQIPNTTIDPDPHSPKYPDDISNTNSDVKRTIDYKFKDGKTAQPTVNDSLHFERTVVIDKVTGDVLSDTWTPSQDFNDVQTPVVQGYTPDRAVVSDKNIGHDHQNIVEHVVYSPNAQHMTITYIDDTIGKKLHTDKLNGVSDQDAKYATGDIIKQYEDQHYKLVSDSTKGKDLIFDHDDNADQSYEVHFVHGTHTISDKRTITETINYRMSDSSTAPNKVEKQVEFNRVGKHDEVTNTDTWDEWQPNKQSFSAVPTPEVKGYTPDIKLVGAKTITAGDKDITETITETITYTPNKQKAKVVFIDDTTKKTLDTHDLIGVTNGHESYSPSEEIDEFVHKHYVFVSSDYPEKDFTYDNDDSKDQVFKVHFKHGNHDISEKKSIIETITYRMSDGSKAPDKVKKQVEFNRVGKHDDVTNTDTWDEWQPNKQSFDAVPTPEIKGYTPDTKLVEAKAVTAGDKDITETITYTPNKQKAKVVFIDDTTKKTLDTHDLTGVTNGHEKYSPSEEIEKFIHDNYVFVSSDYPEKGFTYDNDDSKDQVFEVHFKERPTESDTPIVSGNTEDNSGSNDTPTDSDEPEKDNSRSDTVDNSSHKTPVKRNSNKKHYGIKKANAQKNANKKHQGTERTNIHKTSKIAKLNPNEVDTKANKLTQTKLGKVQEPTNNTLPQTGNKQSGLMAALGLAISSLGMIGVVKSKKRKDNE